MTLTTSDRGRDRSVRGLILQAVMCALLVLPGSGCGNIDITGKTRATPAPLRDDFPYEFENVRRMRVWGAENFTVLHDDHTHFMVVRGLIAPKPGQEYYHEGRDALLEYYSTGLRVVVHRRGNMECEIVDLFDGDENVGLKLIREGHAWYNGDSFEGCELYLAAQQQAQSQCLGLWGGDGPMHPAEFLQRRQQSEDEAAE